MAAPLIPDRLEFHIIKSNYFRVIYSEGAWGGISPRGKIHIAFFNERNAIPQKTSIPVKQSGPRGLQPSGEEEVLEGRKGIVREVETEVVMDLQAAIDLHTWLGQKIAELKGATG